MKKRKSAFLMLCMCAIISFTGCSDDDGYSDVDGQDPSINLTTSHIQSDIGREFTIAGKVEDKDGLKSIRLQNALLNLDKTIDLLSLYEELLTEYNLEYKFRTPADLQAESLEISVTVTDIGNRSTESKVLVTMDGDFIAPVFTAGPDGSVTVLIKEETNFNLKFTVTDNKALDYATVSIPEIDFSKEIKAEGDLRVIDFKESILLPSEPASYNLTIVVADKFDNKVERKSVINISEMPDFQKMYLADVATAEELNSDVFGVPMLIERTGEYQYKANYYCQRAGTEIFFLPQKGDFTPICFGLDPEDNTRLTDEPDLAQPIVLTQANVYYEITFDIIASTYEISTYSVNEAIDPTPHKFGTISQDTWENGTLIEEFYFGYMTGNPREVERFTQDEINPHLFYLEGLSLEAGTQMNFVIHNWHREGWWNYCTWRVDNSEEPETFEYYGTFKNPAWTKPKGNDNWAKPTVNQTGTYTLHFDAHLGRGKIVRE